METHVSGRRAFLKQLSVLGAVGLPGSAVEWSRAVNNVLPSVQQKFAETYKSAGGRCEYHLFENSVHEWVAQDGPQTDRAREMVKQFIASQLKAME